MSSSSPAPDSPPSAVPPVPATAPPPSSTNSTDSPPPPPPSSDSQPPPPAPSDADPPVNAPPPQPSPPPPTQSNANPPPPDPTPLAPSPPPPSPPPPVTPPPSPPPPVSPSPPPPGASPPPTSPPPLPTPPPTQPVVSPPPPPPPSPPKSPPPPPSNPPESSPVPPPPPVNSPPPSPPPSSPPKNPPPPPTPSIPPKNSPQPPPPPTPSIPPKRSPQPPTPTPSRASPPPPPASTPSGEPPPPPTPTPPIPQPTQSSPSPFSPPSLDPPANNPSSTPLVASNSKGIGTTGAVAIGLVAGFLVLGLIAFVVWCLCIRKKRKQGPNGGYVMPSSPTSSSMRTDSSLTKAAYSSAPLVVTGSGSSGSVYSSSEAGGLGNSRPFFTYGELVKATNNFSAENLLGEGGFGSVYKGYLPDDRVVAVKQLKVGGGQGEREFQAEVETISRIHHRHLVSLVGYCISQNQRLLVYEYVPNNTLYFHLHGQGRPVLDWARRVKIAAGAARGIAYLHQDCHPRIIHRDIKSSNILLNENFEARVSDFGLAKIALDMFTHITTRVMGTFGYMAPEYASSGKLTEKSDVYSFGVVLLELITGRKPVDTSQPLGDESLVEWARPLLNHAIDSGNFEGLADPRIEGNYVESEMFRMIEAAAVCVRHSAAKRPRMGQVARAFDSLDGSDLTNGMRPGQSEVFTSAQQSAEIRFFRKMAFGSQNYSTEFFSSPNSSTNV